MTIYSLNKRQAGASLMEVLVAMSISLVVTAAMIALMGNSLASTARIIQMTKLSDDLRVALQMMSRDVRRSSYNANSMYCYDTNDCDVAEVTAAGDITLARNNADTPITVNDCFTFLLDRDQDGDSTEDGAGGFRRIVEDGVGSIEMWTGDSSPSCAAAARADGWVQITDPESMNISGFAIDDDLSYTQEIFNDGTNTVRQRVRKVRMAVQGNLVLDPTITRQMEDIIAIRNDVLIVDPPS